MAAILLERDQFLVTLDELLRQAAAGHGQLALVSGEAGIGKTSLVERFIEQRQPGARTLWGACEALFTPRPLGPLYDIAHQTQAPLRALLDGQANRATLFAAVMDDLTHCPAPTIVILEDLHWADEATLDLVKFLARRIHRTSALLIATYRDEELGREHPLRLVLGDLPARAVTRLRLPPLSETAVATLARQADRPIEGLYLATSGNPFFLGAMLASDAPGVPTSVSDAVLAQVTRRSPEARRLLELVAVVPTRVEWWAVEAVGAAYGAGLEECLAAGLLQLEGGAVGYRHELARQAVEGALAPTRRRALHAEVLQALLGRGVEQASLARLAHHAAAAEDGALVLRFAPAAAKLAAAQGAHREAAAHYATALRYSDGLDAEQRAELLDGLSHESYLTRHFADAVQSCEAALAIWRSQNRPEQVGHDLRRLSRLSWFLGRNSEAKRHGMAAVEVLESFPPSRQLAMAYANMSNLCMVVNDTAQTLDWGKRAIALAERLHDDETVSSALNSMGSVELADGGKQGFGKLERSLQLALEHGYEEHAARAYINLAVYAMRFRAFQEARRHITDGIAYCSDRDLDTYLPQLITWRALAALEQGNWASAGEDAHTALGIQLISPVDKVHALVALGTVRLRRGDPDAESVLDEARDLALATGELERTTRVMAARAEAAWLRAELAQCAVEAGLGFELACGHPNPWLLGQFAFWLWRAGTMTQAPPGAAAPFALQMASDWRAAAAAWEQLGCPYERALALADGDEPAQRAALALFERLGAAPAAALVRRRLRAAGWRGLPRGPRPATRANPQGLTPRQLEVLALLAEGLRNQEIADRLSTTPKTVEHHVSAVLAKLEARSRAEAVRVAHRLGLLPPHGHAAYAQRGVW